MRLRNEAGDGAEALRHCQHDLDRVEEKAMSHLIYQHLQYDSATIRPAATIPCGV